MTNLKDVFRKRLLPDYFYSLKGVCNGKPRWEDEFADEAPSIIRAQDLDPVRNRLKYERNVAYSKWLAGFFTKTESGFKPTLSGKKMAWQVIQVMTADHADRTSADWWGDYRDCVFRAFLSPEVRTCPYTSEYRQWYLLCPEDCELVNRYEIEKASKTKLPPRDVFGYEKFFSADKRLRRARLIPCECCRHFRHETTAGNLPDGL